MHKKIYMKEGNAQIKCIGQHTYKNTKDFK